MADRSRRSSTELGPDDLSTPAKRAKRSEASSVGESSPAEEHPTGLESAETPSTSETSARTTEAAPVQEGDKSLGDVAESAGTSAEQSFALTGEVSLSSTERLARASPELSGEREADIATASTEATPSSSRAEEEQASTSESIVGMRYTEQRELSGISSRASGSGQIHQFLMGEHASYEDLSLIGNGAYGTVYKAKDRNSGQVVALKKVRVPLTEDGLPTSTIREIATLKQLEQYDHPHIVKLLDVCQGSCLNVRSDDGERSGRLDRSLTLWLVFEHVERDLASYIANSPRSGIPAYLIRRMSKEILCGVEFLHSHRIIHRDLKPQNLLVTRDGKIKIADFGLAKTYDFEMRLTSVVVTQWYRAPEVLLGRSYATPVDMWSVGCIIAELCKMEPLFPGTSEGDQLDRIFQVIGTPPKEEWPENVSLSWTAFPHRQPKPLGAIIPDLSEHGLDLIKSMLMFEPHSRITAAQAVRHRYFSEGNA